MKPIHQTYTTSISRFCVNGTLYVGYTKNIEKRIAAHNAGHGGRYTRINRPLTLVAFWSLNNRLAAIKKERLIKRLQTEQKLQLAELTADYYLGCP